MITVKKYSAIAVALLLSMPSAAHATFAVVNATNGVSGLIAGIANIINIFMPLVVIITVVMIIWGAVQIIIGGGSEESRQSGRAKILWGLIGLFLALASWALVSIVANAVIFQGTPTILTNNRLIF